MEGKLTAVAVRSMKTPGEYADGQGLYLKVTPTKTKSWVYRYQRHGKRVKIGIGSTYDLSLRDARAQVRKYRGWLLEGKDPRSKRDAERKESLINSVWTFERCAKEYIDAHAPSWKNAKHADQWRNTLSQYAHPVLGHIPVEEIDTGLIMRVIEPIWLKKTETASRVCHANVIYQPG